MLNSVGVIEIKSIAKGIEAADEMLKSSQVTLISAQPACPGKYEIIITGKVSDVQIAAELIEKKYASVLIDSVVMGRIDETVIKALMGAGTQAPKGALGIIETFSAASAIKAADTAVKAATVNILELRVSRGMGGKGFAMLTGDVGDVTAAVEAGSMYAKQQGLFTESTVIANPKEEIWNYI